MTPGGALARRYARALFELGKERGDVAAQLERLGAFVELVEGNADLRRVLFTPIHPRAERRGVVSDLAARLGMDPELRAFMLLLVDQNRMQHVPEIRDALGELVEQAAGRIEARVVSARPLKRPQLKSLREALSRRVGAEVTIDASEDPELIGGLVAHVGDLMIDGSVRTQLGFLARSLRRGSE